jgi:hypothetical protein
MHRDHCFDFAMHQFALGIPLIKKGSGLVCDGDLGSNGRNLARPVSMVYKDKELCTCIQSNLLKLSLIRLSLSLPKVKDTDRLDLVSCAEEAV